MDTEARHPFGAIVYEYSIIRSDPWHIVLVDINAIDGTNTVTKRLIAKSRPRISRLIVLYQKIRLISYSDPNII